MTESFIVEPLAPAHDRKAFQCGVDALDRYFWQQAGQDVRRRVSACFVLKEIATDTIAGFYTLSAGSVPTTDLPGEMLRRLPRYPEVPVVRLGRLAVSLAYRCRDLGAGLLWDAYERAQRSEIAAFAIVVDAKDEQAARFYIRHEFTPIDAAGLKLIRPL